jgi:GntR family transcriptional regulator
MAGLRQSQFETEVDVVELGTRRPPRAIAEALETSGELLHILRVRRQRRTGEPLMVTEAWLPGELTDALTESALRRVPLYQLLSDAGIVMDRVRHEITAEIAGPRNAHLLDTAIGAALLRVNRLVFVADAPHHHLSVLLSPNRSRLLLSQSADELEMADGLTIAHDVARTRASE